MTALAMAAITSAKLTELLLRRSANVAVCARDGSTALDAAVEADNVEVAQLLLTYGASPRAHSKNGTTAMHGVRSVKMLRLLLQHGAAIDACGVDGSTRCTMLRGASGS